MATPQAASTPAETPARAALRVNVNPQTGCRFNQLPAELRKLSHASNGDNRSKTQRKAPIITMVRECLPLAIMRTSKAFYNDIEPIFQDVVQDYKMKESVPKLILTPGDIPNMGNVNENEIFIITRNMLCEIYDMWVDHLAAALQDAGCTTTAPSTTATLDSDAAHAIAFSDRGVNGFLRKVESYAIHLMAPKQPSDESTQSGESTQGRESSSSLSEEPTSSTESTTSRDSPPPPKITIPAKAANGRIAVVLNLCRSSNVGEMSELSIARIHALSFRSVLPGFGIAFPPLFVYKGDVLTGWGEADNRASPENMTEAEWSRWAEGCCFRRPLVIDGKEVGFTKFEGDVVENEGT
ncbi:hypothetical protein BU24DRAFT_473366 [Aaosphaeria arxii CBS 175.79]|uniref:Uncharacterized protein n=1 Tax=Aaosphaeria arxii CBS 175.79 TaxID=1450172 RepID=A0A6A5XB98_9PLEO|nr:uncharacterized protein BU24DRAFT_473366 [Aaosphaeria arxii CBS 175.79]KAF2010190.1 hypothetical protein BU24DRAFT_473366 [Aaosphaeria arxii CBS 175.79]